MEVEVEAGRERENADFGCSAERRNANAGV